MSLKHESAVASLMSANDHSRLYQTATQILRLTFLVEGIGALVLFVLFLSHGQPWGQALWRGVFTSVSAFCNAGFALHTDNLVGYQSSPLVVHTVGALIVFGGLSPAAALALPLWIKRRSQPIAAQLKLIIVTTSILLLVGTGLYLALEWSHSLATLSIVDKLHNAWFQSVTLRTAGFNTVDITKAHHATVIVMILLMFIGGSPGGTAGGIKTTTAAILFLSVSEAVRGQWKLAAFSKAISDRTRHKATVVTLLAGTTFLLAFVALLLTQRMSAREAAFEVMSALGTVGLTIGGTPKLDEIGKLIISACMFVGRVGGLTVLLLLSRRHQPRILGRPEEEIDVG